MCQYQNEKNMYILRSKINEYKKHIEQAKQIITESLDKSKKPILSFSSGKDSIVMLDMAVKLGFNGKLIFFKYGIETDVETPAENIELLKYYADLYGLEYCIIDCLGEVDCWEQCGRFTLFPETLEEKKIFRFTNYDYLKKINQFESAYKNDLTFIGMRKDESKKRKNVLSKNGAIYQTKSHQSKTCCPLLNLTNEDIWAYIFSNDLKYLSIYDYEYIDRRRNRNEITLLYNDSIIRNGAIYHYKQMYPMYFNWIKKRWGNMI